MSTNSDKSEFKAWIDKMPGAHHTLHVTGTVTVPTTGYHGSLVDAVPQGINPQILILDLKLVKPTGPAGQMISHIPVTYEKPNSSDYREVTIRGDGAGFTIPVKIVH